MDTEVFFGPIISVPDGSRFWSLNLDNTLRLWRVDPLECVYQHAIEVTAMALSSSTLFTVEPLSSGQVWGSAPFHLNG